MAYITIRKDTATSPRADWWDDAPLIPNLEVDGSKTVDTGLVDSRGNEIHRTSPPIGFGRDREW